MDNSIVNLENMIPKGLKFFFLVNMVSIGGALAQPDVEGGPIPVNPLTPGVLDGVVLESHVPLKKPIPYDYVREADMIWNKRVWRSIDLREKMNHPLYFPHDKVREVFDFNTNTNNISTESNSRQWSLWRIIKYHAFDKLLKGEAPDITIFRAMCEGCTFEDGDGFKYPVVPTGPNGYRDESFISDVAGFFTDLIPGVDQPVLDEDGDIVYDDNGNPKIIPGKDSYKPRLTQEIVKYDIKEEWFFDKERSVLDVRILGIAPVVQERDPANGRITGKEKRLFWIYFPECRPVFSRYFVFNQKNDAMRMSFDDIFWKRQFSSYITKENNVYDREINDIKLGVDALLESERIKELIFTFEQDVWHF
jgi:hypothetical protein